MFVLTKIISRLLFPVALIIELLITGLILIRFKHRRSGYCLCLAALLLLVTASMNPAADLFLRTLEGRYQPIGKATPELKKKVQYIVVLGSGHSEQSDLPAVSRLSPSGTKRVIEGVRLSRMFPGIPVIFTGGVIKGKTAISEVASLAAVSYGMQPSRIITEKLARNTEEEAQSVFKLIQVKTIILVTSAFHMRRAFDLFRKTGIQVVPAPTDYLTASGSYSPWDLIPSTGALQKTETACYEYMGLAWNAVRGVGL